MIERDEAVKYAMDELNRGTESKDIMLTLVLALLLDKSLIEVEISIKNADSVVQSAFQKI